VVDRAGNQSPTVEVAIPDSDSIIPPDPATLASPLDPTRSTSLAEATAFLYTGANPVQRGVASGTIDVRRAAVVRGRVQTRDGQPLHGVTVSLQGHPELGHTVSRRDGLFDLVVNGGGNLVINYQKDGYLPVQRIIDTEWQDFAWAEDIVMIPVDDQVSTINLNSTQAFQVAQGNPVTDADGTRQATVLFPQGTTATMTLADGSTQSLTTLNVRATEYTVGENGPNTMPGELPELSGYTYAVELSVDEAISSGATRVDFSQALPFYVTNFLEFPVGEIVPIGWYDREQAAWIPSDDGRIIQVLSVDASGLAVLDVEGNGQPATQTELDGLGITNNERVQLAQLYTPGDSLWRSLITHFTPWDCNWPYGPPLPPPPPPPADPAPDTADDNKDDDPDEECNSIIECQGQVLGETISITGTEFSLNYRSDRVEGRKTGRAIRIPVTGSVLHSEVSKLRLEIYIAGRKFDYILSLIHI